MHELTTRTSGFPAELNSSALKLPSAAFFLIDVLEEAGYEAWCVGGFVRDALLGRPSHDVDVATSALWPEVKRVCEDRGMHIYETGSKHGTVTVVVPFDAVPDAYAHERDTMQGSKKVGGHLAENAHPASTSVGEDEHNSQDAASVMSIEVTTFRCDGCYDDARHPTSVRFVSSIEEDLARRDFTINALAYHPKRGLLDPFGGVDDLQEGIIRVVGEPDKRFSEDALRILRGCRFRSQLGFSIDADTYQAMLSHKYLLSKVSTERITHEIDALLLGDHVHDALLETVDVLSFVLPELVAMKGFAQATQYHIYDVLEHTAYVVQNMPPTRLGRWAALCHDMGKPAAAFFAPDGVEHFYGHAHVSVDLAQGLMDRLLMSNSFKAQVLLLVKYHDEAVEPNARGVRRMLMKLEGDAQLFEVLCDLKRADALSQSPLCHGRAEGAAELKQVLNELLAHEQVPSIKSLAVNGHGVLALGIEPGPEVGRILSSLLDAVVDERVKNEREPLLELAQSMVRETRGE